ncbi:MAG: hypothetical protein K0R49_1417 [Burkholderiales bacterium]|jgi:hypothetical protein|nr:hypothetical protein [Burkholderiales bacterium]
MKKILFFSLLSTFLCGFAETIAFIEAQSFAISLF